MDRELPEQIALRLEGVRELAIEYRWRLVVLFGSTVRDGEGRDIDLALLPESRPDLWLEARWLRRLEELFEPERVDLLLLTLDTSPILRFEVMREAIPLYEAEDDLFERERDRAFFLQHDARMLQRRNGIGE